MREPVVDHPVLAGQRARHQQPRLVGDLACVDERRHREHLLDRPRLVDVADRTRAQIGLGRLERGVGVERREVGERQRLAGPCVHHDRDARVAAGVLDRLTQHPLGIPLQVAVDRGVQVLAVDGLGHRALAERHLGSTGDGVARRAVGAREQTVEGAFEAGERTGVAVVVGRAQEADEVGGDVVGGVGPHLVAPGREAVEAQRLGAGDDLGGQGRRHAASDVLEAAVLGAQARQDREVVKVELVGEELRELGCPVDGVAVLIGVHQLRVGDDHQSVDRVRERLAEAIRDLAALGRQHDVDHAFGCGHGGVGARVDALQLDQARPEDREHHRDHDEPDAQSHVRRAPPGVGRSRRGAGLADSTHASSPVCERGKTTIGGL
ncbi:unannotated protein [freshwater metagenome]|uniref:Unannotated protein n=1 Tax=freshwater metagenome TaxID=449393 RepID=A0A6J6NT68_9ZZZZ